MRKFLFFVFLLPSLVYADRFDAIKSGANVLLSTQTAAASLPCGNSGDVQINLNGSCGGIGSGVTGSGSNGISSISVNNGIVTAVTGNAPPGVYAATQTILIPFGAQVSTISLTTVAPGVLHTVGVSSNVSTALVSLSTEVTGTGLAAGVAHVVSGSLNVATSLVSLSTEVTGTGLAAGVAHVVSGSLNVATALVSLSTEVTGTGLAAGVAHIVSGSLNMGTALVSLSTEVTGSLPAASIASGNLGAGVVAAALSLSTFQVGGLNLSSGGLLTTNGQRIGLVFSTSSVIGTYNVTAATATVAVGSSSSTITITSSGTYLLFGGGNLIYSGATFAASQFITINLFRQNNTLAVLPNTQVQLRTRIITTITDEAGDFQIPLTVYTTGNINDVLSLQISVAAAPSAGTLQVNQAHLLALRLF